MFLRVVSLMLLLFVCAGCEKSPTAQAGAFASDEIQKGVKLLPTFCNTCHGIMDRTMDEMLAPPMWGVRAHYLRQYPEPEAFVAAMTDFMSEPHEDKSLMPLEVKRYGLMAPVPLSDAQLRATAMAIYAGKIERPVWLRDYEKLHKDCESK